MLRLSREIGPLVRVGGAVVKFFIAVRVADVAPAFGANGVVVSVKRRERRVRPRRAWPPKQRHQRMALEFLRRRAQAAKLAERRVQVDQANRPRAVALGQAGAGKDQRDAGGLPPQ